MGPATVILTLLRATWVDPQDADHLECLALSAYRFGVGVALGILVSLLVAGSCLTFLSAAGAP